MECEGGGGVVVSFNYFLFIIHKNTWQFSFLNTILLSFQDGPAETSVANGGTAAAATALNDDLDIFGPMISNPLPAAAVPPSQVSVIYLYLFV